MVTQTNCPKCGYETKEDRSISDIDSLGTYYTTYTLTVKYITVPGGSSHSVGQTAATMTIAAPDPTAIGSS